MSGVRNPTQDEVITFIKNAINKYIYEHIQSEIDSKKKLVIYDPDRTIEVLRKKLTEENNKILLTYKKQLKLSELKKILSHQEQLELTEIKKSSEVIEKTELLYRLKQDQEKLKKLNTRKDEILNGAKDKLATQYNQSHLAEMKAEIDGKKKQLLIAANKELTRKLQILQRNKDFKDHMLNVINLFSRYAIRQLRHVDIHDHKMQDTRKAAEYSYKKIRGIFQKTFTIKTVGGLGGNPILNDEDFNNLFNEIMKKLTTDFAQYASILGNPSDEAIDSTRTDDINFTATMDIEGLVATNYPSRSSAVISDKTEYYKSLINKTIVLAKKKQHQASVTATIETNQEKSQPNIDAAITTIVDLLKTATVVSLPDELVLNLEKINNQLPSDSNQQDDDLPVDIATFEEIGIALAQLSNRSHWSQDLEVTELDDDPLESNKNNYSLNMAASSSSVNLLDLLKEVVETQVIAEISAKDINNTSVTVLRDKYVASIQQQLTENLQQPNIAVISDLVTKLVDNCSFPLYLGSNLLLGDDLESIVAIFKPSQTRGAISVTTGKQQSPDIVTISVTILEHIIQLFEKFDDPAKITEYVALGSDFNKSMINLRKYLAQLQHSQRGKNITDILNNLMKDVNKITAMLNPYIDLTQALVSLNLMATNRFLPGNASSGIEQLLSLLQDQNSATTVIAEFNIENLYKLTDNSNAALLSLLLNYDIETLQNKLLPQVIGTPKYQALQELINKAIIDKELINGLVEKIVNIITRTNDINAEVVKENDSLAIQPRLIELSNNLPHQLSKINLSL